MATLVCFHAHPDDECIATGGVMRHAAEHGHRVVLVVATKGEHGEVVDGFLDPGEQLWERRERETHAAAEILGVSRVEFLGYHDSGMMDTPENELPDAFWRADIEEAAARLAAILEDEGADVLTHYDDHGTYGHPDHIQVHRVGTRAAELAGTTKVYEATMNRDHLNRGIAAMAEQARAAGAAEDDIPKGVGDEFGSPEAIITAAVDVTDVLDMKRKAMAAHASQISDSSFFLSMPEEAFAAAFGTEWYIRDGEGPGITETDLFAGIE